MLYLGEWRKGFNINELRALFWECQRVRALESKQRAAAAHLASQAATIEGLEKQVYWYRRQLVAESRLGLALARINS